MNDSLIRRLGVSLGFVDAAPSEIRRVELPIVSSPYAGVSPVNLSTADVGVSIDRAVGLAGVFAAVQKLTGSISQLELGVYRNGVEIPQPTTSLVVQPDISMPLSAFLEQTMTSSVLNGNFYWLLNNTGPDAPVQNITVLNPNTVHIEYDDSGTKWYRDGDQRYPAWRIYHGFNVRLPGYTYGVGPIQVCQNELRGALDLRNYADNWFSDAKQPPYYLRTDQTLSSDMLSQYGTAWVNQLAAGQVPVVGGGVTVVPLALNPADAQWLENQRFTQAQIARMFGVPGILLDLPSGDSMTYSNREDVINDYYRFTLKKYMTEIEGGFSSLLVRGQTAKFKVDPLLGMQADIANTPAPDGPVIPNTNENGDTNGNGN